MTESDTDVTYEVHGPERHDVPAAGRSGFVVIDDRQVHYLEWGAAGAPAVIALHGGGQTAYMFEEIGRELRSTHHVIAPDLPGHGESEALSHDPRDFSRQTLAATLPGLLAEFGIEHASFIGASLGGILSLTLAAADPAKVNAIALIDVGHRLEEAGVRRIVEFMGKHESFGSLAEAAEAVAEFNPDRPKADPERLRRNLRQRPDGRWTWKHNLGAVSAERIKEVKWEDDILAGLGDDAAKITVPVLVLRGQKSDVLSSDGAEEVAALLPNGRLVEVHNAGHLAAGDNPESTVSLIRGFLNEIEGNN
ncbi:MAG: alpha/beta hydrolase [Frankiaceae bacterium]|nr:alpha/beta hydrolase [Frankiaceae bacterium]